MGNAPLGGYPDDSSLQGQFSFPSQSAIAIPQAGMPSNIGGYNHGHLPSFSSTVFGLISLPPPLGFMQAIFLSIHLF
jgi:hypothetical protein